MIEKSGNESCRMPMDGGIGSCKVESVISIDDRGQMVLPKEIRDKAQIHAGDKLAVICSEHKGKVCCITLVKTDAFGDMVKSMLGPMLKEIFE